MPSYISEEDFMSPPTAAPADQATKKKKYISEEEFMSAAPAEPAAPVAQAATSPPDPAAQLMSTAPESDPWYKRGAHQLGSSLGYAKDMTAQDYGAAAQGIADAVKYQQANRGSEEIQQIHQAYEKGDGFFGGIKEAGKEMRRDITDAPTAWDAVVDTGKNVAALGAGIGTQAFNMIPPMTGMVAGGVAGSPAGPLGVAGGAFAGASAGNTAVEGQGIALNALAKAGIDPADTPRVTQFLEENALSLFGKAATKGSIIGLVDTITAGIGGKILTAPARAAVNRALMDMGVDVADNAAVAAVKGSREGVEQIASRLATDATYQASKTGAGRLGRNSAAFALEPAGEFTGEFVGSGVAEGKWDTKEAGLEALSSLGHGGMTFAGQKAYQAITKPSEDTSGPSAENLARNQAVMAIKQANLPTDDLLQMRSEPAAMAQYGLTEADLDAVINDRDDDLARAKQVLLSSGENGPLTRAAGAGINIEQATIVMERDKARTDATRDRYFGQTGMPQGQDQSADDMLHNANMDIDWEQQSAKAGLYNKTRNVPQENYDDVTLPKTTEQLADDLLRMQTPATTKPEMVGNKDIDTLTEEVQSDADWRNQEAKSLLHRKTRNVPQEDTGDVILPGEQEQQTREQLLRGVAKTTGPEMTRDIDPQALQEEVQSDIDWRNQQRDALLNNRRNNLPAEEDLGNSYPEKIDSGARKAALIAKANNEELSAEENRELQSLIGITHSEKRADGVIDTAANSSQSPTGVGERQFDDGAISTPGQPGDGVITSGITPSAQLRENSLQNETPVVDSKTTATDGNQANTLGVKTKTSNKTTVIEEGGTRYELPEAEAATTNTGNQGNTGTLSEPAAREGNFAYLIDEIAPEAKKLQSVHKRIGSLKSDVETVQSTGDAANILRPLGRRAQESLMVLVLDKNKKPLAVLQHGVGGIDYNSVHPGILAGSIHNIKGAHTYYMAHNHPSGNMQASPQDVSLTGAINNGLEGTGVTMGGHLILTPNGNTSIMDKYGTIQGRTGTVSADGRAKSVKVTERMLQGDAPNVLQHEAITSTSQMLHVINEHSGGKPGVLLLNTQNQPVEFVPVTREEMAALRTGEKKGAAARLYRAMERNNTNSAAINLVGDDSVSENIATFLKQAGMRTLDAISDTGSLLEQGTLAEKAREDNVFFSISEEMADEDTESLEPRYSIRTWTDEEKDEITETARKFKIPKKKAEKWLKDIDNVMAIILNNPDLDFDASAAGLYKALKANSDPHYSKSLDFSTLCRKRYVLAATIEQIQLELGQAVTQDNLVQIREMLKKKKITVSCGACYVDSKRMQQGKYINQFIAAHPDEDPRQFLTQKNVDKLKRDKPKLYAEFKEKVGANNGKTSESRVDYDGDIREFFVTSIAGKNRVLEFNKRSGLRWQSWSDFEVPHLMDAMQAILDMALAKLKGHSYTKVPAFVRAMGRTGLMINVSLIPQGNGFNADGSLAFDPVEGMPFETALELRNKYPDTVGTIAIAVSNEHTVALMADPRIDYIIPYHASGLSRDIAERFGMSKWEDYTKTQTSVIDDVHKFHAVVGKNIPGANLFIVRNTATVPPSMAANKSDSTGVKKKKESERTKFFTAELTRQQADPKAFAKTVEAYLSTAAGKKDYAKYMSPYAEPDFTDYWSDNRTGKENGDHFLRLLAERGVLPKFREHRYKTGRNLANFTTDPNYWKLLIDRKSYDHSGKNITQRPVTPEYDFDEIQAIYRDYEPAPDKADKETVTEFLDIMAKAQPVKLKPARKGGVKKSTVTTADDAKFSRAVLQSISSAATSLRQVPAMFKRGLLQPGTVNVDIGGGKYDDGTNYLKNIGVENLVFDPYNREQSFNDSVVRRLSEKTVDSATVNNVLNVIQEKDARLAVIRQAAKAINQDGKAYFQIHEGDRTGRSRVTKVKDGVAQSWQNHQPTQWYMDEVATSFGEVTRKGNLIIASIPKKNGAMAIWTDSAGQPMFSSTDIGVQEETSDTRAELTEILGEAGVQNLLNAGTVRLVGSQEQAKGIIARAKKRGVKHSIRYSKNGKVQGFTFGKKVYLVSDGIAKGKAFAVLKHELGVHLRQAFLNDADFQSLLQSLEERQTEASETGKAIRVAMSRVPKATKPEHYWEEVLAYMVEANPNNTLVKKFWAKIKQLLRSLGINIKQLTADDMNNLAMAAVHAEASGRGKDFDAWFAGSVITENGKVGGKPMRLYHAGNTTIKAFKRGLNGLTAHFGTAAAAEDKVTADVGEGLRSAVGNRTTPVFLNMTNPVRMSDVHFDEAGTFAVDLLQRGTLSMEDLRDIDPEFRVSDQDTTFGVFSDSLLRGKNGDNKVIGLMVEKLEQKGYDGIVYNNRVESAGEDSYIPFYPQQIKSAIGNGGKYNPEKPDILMSTDKFQKVTQKMLESEAFKQWFGDSAIKAKDGKPVTVYHGSPKVFYTFDNNKLGGNTNQSLTGLGHFFAISPAEARGYAGPGGETKPFLLRIEKPLVIHSWMLPAFDTADDARAYAKRQKELNGYDGIYLKDQGHLIAFDGNQMKSGEYNTGAFSRNDNDVRYSIEDENETRRQRVEEMLDQVLGAGRKVTQARTKKLAPKEGAGLATLNKSRTKIGNISPSKVIKRFDGYEALVIALENDRLDNLEKQRLLSQYINQFDREVRGTYGLAGIPARLTEARTEKTRTKIMFEALQKINRAHADHTKKQALRQIVKAIKDNAPKLKGSIARQTSGGIDLYKELKEIAKILRLTPEAVEAHTEYHSDQTKIDQRVEALLARTPLKPGQTREQQRDDISQQEEMESLLQLRRLSVYGALKYGSAEDAVGALAELKDTIAGKKSAWILEIEALFEARQLARNDAITVLSGGKGLKTPVQRQKDSQAQEKLLPRMLEQIRGFDDKHQSFEWLLDKLSRYDKASGILNSTLVTRYGQIVHRATYAEQASVREVMAQIQAKREEIYNLKGKALEKRLTRDTAIVDDPQAPGIWLRNTSGIKTERVPMSQNQAYKRWLEWQDPSLQEQLTEQGYDYETMLEIEQFMLPETKEWARWQLQEFYPSYYAGVNEAFKKLFYTEMPFNKAYSPIKRLYARGKEDQQLLTNVNPHSSVIAGGVKNRTANTREIILQDGDAALVNHIAQMEHFKSWGQPMRELRATLGSEQVRMAVQDHHGKTALEVLDTFLDDFARGRSGNDIEANWTTYFRTAFTTAAIGLNPVVFLKQLTSIPAYALDMPPMEWARYFPKTLAQAKKALEVLRKSDMVKDRYEIGFERDMTLAMSRSNAGKLSGTKKMADKLMILTKLGDGMAIILGGWPVYQYNLKQALAAGKPQAEAEKEAMEAFEMATERTQQASAIKDQMHYQRGGPFLRLFTMFMTSPASYYRQWAGSIRHLLGKGTDKKDAAKRFAITQFVLPAAFQLVASGFRLPPDDDDWWKSVALGPLSGVIFVRDIGGGLWNAISGDKVWNPPGLAPPFATFDEAKQFTGQVRQMLEKPVGDWMTDPDFWDTILTGGTVAGNLTGIPVGPASRWMDGVGDAISGDTVAPVRRAMGFSEKKLDIAKGDYQELKSQIRKEGRGATGYEQMLAAERRRKVAEKRIAKLKEDGAPRADIRQAREELRQFQEDFVARFKYAY